MSIWRSLMSCGYVAVLVFAGNDVEGQTEPASSLGALSDDPAKVVKVDGRSVTLFQASRNALLRADQKFSDVMWYYMVPPTIKKMGNQVEYSKIGPDLSDAQKKTLQVLIGPAEVNRTKVFEALKKIDPYVDSPDRNLAPVVVYGFSLSLLNSEEKEIPNQTPGPFVEPISLTLSLTNEQAQAAKSAIESGSQLTVGYATLVKLSQVSRFEIDWEAVKNTETFRKYDGPSGPTFITAQQSAQIAYDIRANLKGKYWNELGGNMSADSDGFRLFFRDFLNRFLVRRDVREVEMQNWADSQRLDVPIAKFQGLVDEVRKVASDSKNLNNQEWCKKYKDELKTSREQAQAREKGAGGSVGFKVFDVFSFDASGNESSTSSSSKDHYEKLASSEDCGKSNVQSNFSFQFDGVKYTPKTIRVYERNKAKGTASDKTVITSYTTSQKLGRNTWSVGIQ